MRTDGNGCEHCGYGCGMGHMFVSMQRSSSNHSKRPVLFLIRANRPRRFAVQCSSFSTQNDLSSVTSGSVQITLPGYQSQAIAPPVCFRATATPELSHNPKWRRKPSPAAEDLRSSLSQIDVICDPCGAPWTRSCTTNAVKTRREVSTPRRSDYRFIIIRAQSNITASYYPAV